MSPGSEFRAHLEATTTLPMLIPSVYDAISAQIAARAGFRAVWLGSSGVSNALLGKPDAGLINLAEMEFVTRKLTATCKIAVLVDADDGYGYALNVIHTVRTLERAGAAGLMIEDQYNPRTPFEGTPAVIEIDEAVGKVAAAVDARTDPSFFICMRTDVAWTEGLEAAIERGRRFGEAGADALFVTGDFDIADLTRIAEEVRVPHLLWNHPRGDRSTLTLEKIRALGFDMHALGASDVTRVSALAMTRYFDDLQARGLAAEQQWRADFVGTVVADWSTFTGFDTVQKLEKKYLPSREYALRYPTDCPDSEEPA